MAPAIKIAGGTGRWRLWFQKAATTDGYALLLRLPHGGGTYPGGRLSLAVDLVAMEHSSDGIGFGEVDRCT
jgi:hypothetical protein